MAIIKQYDKRSGITYAYESVAYWDPEKKMSRAKRKLIGRINPETGEIIPTDGRNRRKKDETEKGEETSPSENYKEMYEKLLKKCESQELIIKSLQERIKELEGRK
ncbi:MAG: hypothetical protein IKH71_11135 [Oscillospiraceae bacterium]|nr:hypothetical protein [Oscillospiraceae bacterium]MBR6836658.1 hypothetical protein [Oscillospiraceae bacterium]